MVLPSLHRRWQNPQARERHRRQSTGKAPALEVGERARAKKLIVRGERHCRQSNIAVARAFFLRAAELGLLMAAFKLAETYDPSALVRCNTSSVVPNPAASS